MERHFHEQLQEVKASLINMAHSVEESISLSIKALKDKNNDLVNEVITMDDDINRLEIKIDDLCLKLLALQQPMAVDLRFITSAMKINNDLERMGDHSVNIAELAKSVNQKDLLKPFLNLQRMAEIAQAMVRDSMQSFVDGSVDKARAVCLRDDEVDRLDEQVSRILITHMMEDPKTISLAIDLMLVSKNIERIADLSTNIAEEVIFIYKAKSIKHHQDDDAIEDIRSRS